MAYTIAKTGSTLVLNVNGDTILCYPSSNGVWTTDSATELVIYKSGNNLMLVSGPVELFAYPLPYGGWLVDGTDGPTPPDPGSGDFSWPFNPNNITYGFRPADRPFHNGIDFAGGSAYHGHHVPAAGPGVVVHAGPNFGYGETVILQHDNVGGATWFTRYAHMVIGSIITPVGTVVAKGDTLGSLNNSGSSFGSHLHWETLIHGTGYANGVDPVDFLAAYGDGNVIYP